MSGVVREHGTVVSEGRRLAVCEVGDPNGLVACYLHGTGGSRLEAAVYAEAAGRHGVRLVSWDRPGAGRTPDDPDRRLLDVVTDARSVAAAVGAERPPVVGLSGGGSHVLALATAADVTRAAVAINPGPPAEDDVLALVPPVTARLIALARDRPRWFRQVARLTQSRGRLGQALQRRQLDPLDLEVVRDPVVAPRLEVSAEEGRLQPGAWTRDAMVIWGRPWGFDPAAPAVPLHVFAGRNDPFAGFSRHLADSGAELHPFEGGHVSGFLPAVLDEVMALVARL
ncbi:alpha/beta fold hydrolase [Auraticoccus monumenti]|uniref:Pimeloyl-ACP methyl ester carboxylesterase n=1 Tax=Auraticoccus monumenti TaxID=675864 RepID=A0A1G6W724_9ACTN|nr:alpha/beta hydrolase [Auraticoccus monumenti]SDD60835.1 Pimeloyl-ACP methyl ester carboxylesterase [Auraticoccus monumenti]